MALGELVNETAIADRIVAPLLVADTGGAAEVIVVLGAGVTGAGACVPNHNSVQRVLHGARAWRAGRAPVVVFTGDAGDWPCTVADAMRNLAVEIGIPAGAIYTERASRSTRENAELSAPLLRRLGARRVLVVTDRLHMRRAAGVFAQLGFEVERASVPIFEGHLDNVSMLSAGIREMAALAYYRMRDWTETPDVIDVAAPRTDTEDISERDMKISNPSGPVVVLGASYAGAWKLDRVAGRAVVNRGVSGQQSFEMLQRFERDVVTAQPRVVILWGFINDIFRSQGDVNATLDRVRQSFTRMIELSRQNGIEPVLATEVTIRPPASWMNGLASIVGAIRGKESYQAGINRRVIEGNQWLADVARREGLLLLDLQATLAEAGGMRRPEFTQEDGSHIAPAGYAAITEYALPILEAHLAGSAASSAQR
jgi:uncharacterized SAM-binding protein YcdF (DUF218 family)